MLEIANETSRSRMKVRRLFVVRFFFIKNLQCFVHNPLLFRLSNSIISKGRMQRTRLFRQEPISFVLRGFSTAFWKRCEQKNANWNHGLSLIQIILVLIIMNLNCSKLHDLSLLTSWKIIKLPFGPVNVRDPGICIHAYISKIILTKLMKFWASWKFTIFYIGWTFMETYLQHVNKTK